MKEFSCGKVVPGCETTFQGESEDEILQQVGAHARDEHSIHVGLAEPPTTNPDTYVDELLTYVRVRRRCGRPYAEYANRGVECTRGP